MTKKKLRNKAAKALRRTFNLSFVDSNKVARAMYARYGNIGSFTPINLATAWYYSYLDNKLFGSNNCPPLPTDIMQSVEFEEWE